MIAASRRSFITGLVALVAAPAIVRAGSLMAVNSGLVPSISMRELVEYAPGQAYVPLDVLYGSMRLPPNVDEITREVVELFRRSNIMMQEIDREYAADRAFVVGEQWTGIRLRYNKERRSIDVVPQIPDSLALAAAAVAIAPVILAQPVTRRFWGK